jgi:D-lactate dehydrogenase
VVPLAPSLVLSSERMNRILEISAANRYARVQPGVTNQQLQDALRPLGFFWPPDPTSAAVCTIGGNLAYNSAGPRAVKYGTPRENTLALRAVIGTGALLATGTRTTKGVVGYDLTRLLIGSEGTLAVISEAVLRLTPLPERIVTLRACYDSLAAATAAVAAVMAQPVVPCALEFMDEVAVGLIRRDPGVSLPQRTRALLMIEVDGPGYALAQMADAVTGAASVAGVLQVEHADDPLAAQRLWQARKALSPALRHIAPKKINEDVVVPVARIPELIEALQRLSRETGITIVNFGHAGNGNIHVNLLFDPEDRRQAERADYCLQTLFDLVLQMDGSLSGEHGVGLAKQPFVGRELGPLATRLMWDIKRQFDPANILNPGKALPDPADSA